ncbi:hypothetical protein PO909_018000, partial [Leuciscus waleckii]
LIFSETVVTCDGFVQRLSCDSDVIRVDSATFGRTNSNICSVGQPQGQTVNTQCSMGVPEVSKRCDGLSVCELNTQGLAARDPCDGSYKYYTTTFASLQKKRVTCHGGYAYLKCESGKIQINTAHYGHTDKFTCSEGCPLSELQNSNCYSPSALAPVSKSCNGLRSCELFATHTVFTDPCIGTYKYLTVSYFCLPTALSSSVICENANNTLICEQGTVINIHNANYGRTDLSTCSIRRPDSQTAKTDCYSSNSQAIVTTACEGINSGVLVASNGVFSDPCVGTLKFLYVSYS